MSVQITQFYRAVVLVGGIQYPIIPTAGFSCPKNFIIPPIIGNLWQFNYTEGFQQPSVDLIFIPRDKGASGAFSEVFSSTFLNYFLRGTADDTSTISGGLVFWNGQDGWTLSGAKADTFSLSVAQGQLIGFTARFLFNGITYLSTAPSFTAWDNSAPLIGKNAAVSFGSAAQTGSVWNLGLTYSNNHTPDMSLNGTNFPTDNNAGMQTAALNFTVQAAQGIQGGTTAVPDNNPVPSSLTTVSCIITGVNGTRTFTVNNPIDQIGNNREVPLGRVMRPHSYVALGGTATTTSPLTIS